MSGPNHEAEQDEALALQLQAQEFDEEYKTLQRLQREEDEALARTLQTAAFRSSAVQPLRMSAKSMTVNEQRLLDPSNLFICSVDDQGEAADSDEEIDLPSTSTKGFAGGIHRPLHISRKEKLSPKAKAQVRNTNFKARREFTLRLPGEEYGLVSAYIGGGKIVCQCRDGFVRQCSIPGRLRSVEWIRVGDIVLIKLRPYLNQSKRGVVVQCYTDEERAELVNRGELQGVDMVHSLPPELCFMIFEATDAPTVLLASQVSHHWQALMKLYSQSILQRLQSV